MIYRKASLWPLIGLFVFVLFTPSRALAQASCDQALATATDYYNNARFGEAIDLLKQCLEQGAFDEAQQPEVYTLLSRLCFANRDEADARHAMRVLLSIKPDYTPDPLRDQPSYRALMEDVRREKQEVAPGAAVSLESTVVTVQPERRGFKKWLFFGGGAVLAGAAALIIGSSSGSSNQGGRGGNPRPPRNSP